MWRSIGAEFLWANENKGGKLDGIVGGGMVSSVEQKKEKKKKDKKTGVKRGHERWKKSGWEGGTGQTEAGAEGFSDHKEGPQ